MPIEELLHELRVSTETQNPTLFMSRDCAPYDGAPSAPRSLDARPAVYTAFEQATSYAPGSKVDVREVPFRHE
jgi:hypothetical protein